MKQFISTLLFFFLFVIATQAQTLETTSEYPTGYLETSYYNGANTIKSIDGVLFMVYSDIPMVLLRYPAANPRAEYEIPSTVRRVANNAFQGTKFLKTLKIHNEVSYGRMIQPVFGETAFNDSSIENFVVIEANETTPTAASAPTARQAPHFEGAYDLSGRPVVGDSHRGILVVEKTDGTVVKVQK